MASFPHSHPPERDVHTCLHFLLPSSFLSPGQFRGRSPQHCVPLAVVLFPPPPSPSCPPWQVPLSAWVRVLPQEWQKVGGAGTWALTSDTRGISWAALGSSFFLCAPVSPALKWGGPHRGDPPGPARVWKHWPSLRHGPAQGGCGSDRALSSACQSLELASGTATGQISRRRFTEAFPGLSGQAVWRTWGSLPSEKSHPRSHTPCVTRS